MNLWKALAVYCCALSVVPGQVTKKGSIAGRIVNSITGETIADVTVFASPLIQRKSQGLPTSRSQSDGSFRFEELPIGQYVIFARKTGFDHDLPGPGAAGVAVIVEPDDCECNIVVPLLPLGTISGKVVDQDGLPLAGIETYALFVNPLWVPARLDQTAQTKTNKAGFYSLPKLESGSYYILAVPKGMSARTDQNGYRQVPTFFPEGGSVAEGVPIFVQPGESSNADVRIHLAPMQRLEGKVEDRPKGITAGQLHLEMSPKSQRQISALRRELVVRSDDSFFAADVASGEYEIGLFIDNGHRRVRVSRLAIAMGSSNLTGLIVKSSQPASLMVSVKRSDSDSEPIGNVGLSLQPSPGGEVTYGQTNGPSGTTQFNDIEPNSYLLDVLPAKSSLFVQSIIFNGQEAANQYVDLPENTSSVATVVLSSTSATIGGKTETSASTVVLAPKTIAPDGSNVRNCAVQTNGIFEFRNVAPGDYTIFAVEQANNWSIWHQPSFLASVDDLGTRIHIDKNDNKQVSLPVSNSKLLRNRAFLLGFYLR